MDHTSVITLTTTQAKAAAAKDGISLKSWFSARIREWHPDICPHPGARDALAQLTKIRAACLDDGPGPTAPSRAFTGSDGKRFALRPVSSFHDGSAEVLVCANSLSRFFSAENADLAEAAQRAVSGFRFADARMETQMRRFLPPSPRITPLEDGGVLHTVPRRRDQIPLADLIRHRGPFEVKTGAWVISGLLNLACWAHWADVVHGGVSPETVLVSPEFHEVALFGGWEFAAPIGERPLALPERTLRLFPGLAAPGALPPTEMDTSLIREIFMTLFGIPDTSRLLAGGVPDPIARWAAFAPASGGAIADYAAWKSALNAAFGAPKFIDMGLTPEDVYAA